MNEVLEKIRKPSIFILLLILNLRFLFTVVFDDRQEILSVLTIIFFLFSLDYSGIRREYLYWIILFVAISVIDFTPYKLNVLTPLILMQCLSRFSIRIYLQYNIIILAGTAIFMLLSFGTGYTHTGTGIDLIRVRSDFGYGEPNIASFYYWGLFISLILYCHLSRYKKLLWPLVSLIFIISLYIYSETVSRSFIIVSVLFVLILGYYTLRSRLKKDYKIGYSRYILFILPLLFTALTIYFGLEAKSYPKLDILLSGRLTLYNGLFQSLTPIQFILGTTEVGERVIDNSYLHILFEAGVFLFVYFIWLYFFAIKNMVKQNNFVVITIFISFLVYGLIESLLLFSVIIGNNLFWVLLYRYRQGEDTEFVFEKEINE